MHGTGLHLLGRSAVCAERSGKGTRPGQGTRDHQPSHNESAGASVRLPAQNRPGTAHQLHPERASPDHRPHHGVSGTGSGGDRSRSIASRVAGRGHEAYRNDGSHLTGLHPRGRACAGTKAVVHGDAGLHDGRRHQGDCRSAQPRRPYDGEGDCRDTRGRQPRACRRDQKAHVRVRGHRPDRRSLAAACSATGRDQRSLPCTQGNAAGSCRESLQEYVDACGRYATRGDRVHGPSQDPRRGGGAASACSRTRARL